LTNLVRVKTKKKLIRKKKKEPTMTKKYGKERVIKAVVLRLRRISQRKLVLHFNEIIPMQQMFTGQNTAVTGQLLSAMVSGVQLQCIMQTVIEEIQELL